MPGGAGRGAAAGPAARSPARSLPGRRLVAKRVCERPGGRLVSMVIARGGRYQRSARGTPSLSSPASSRAGACPAGTAPTCCGTCGSGAWGWRSPACCGGTTWVRARRAGEAGAVESFLTPPPPPSPEVLCLPALRPEVGKGPGPPSNRRSPPALRSSPCPPASSPALRALRGGPGPEGHRTPPEGAEGPRLPA